MPVLRSVETRILLAIIDHRGGHPMLSNEQLSDLARNGGGSPNQTAATQRFPKVFVTIRPRSRSSLKCLLPTDMLGRFEEQRLPNSVHLCND